MAEMTLEAAPGPVRRPPSLPAAPPGLPQRSSVTPGPGRSVHDPLRDELSGYYERLKKFRDTEPDSVLIEISGISARLTEMRAVLQRQGNANANSLRTKEVDPLIEALDFQFKIHSRLLSVRQLDWEMTRGAPS